MESWGSWIKRYVLNLDAIIAICLVAVVVYFILTRKKKKYKFQGLTPDDEFQQRRAVVKKKKAKKLNKHEEECRRIFQEMFGVKFSSCRPSILRNPVTGKNLELDGYNADIVTPLGKGLAFEYDGEQHSKFNSHFHQGGPDEFVYQVKKDSWKDLKCKEHKILLIRIPHFVAFQDLRRYIRNELDRQKVSVPLYTPGPRSNIYG
jgi:hypothetical protein